MSGGSVTLNGDGTVTFKSAQDFNGRANFDFVLHDGAVLILDIVVGGSKLGSMLRFEPTLRLALSLLGIATIGLGSGFYLTAGHGPGPRDGWMTGIHVRTGWPISGGTMRWRPKRIGITPHGCAALAIPRATAPIASPSSPVRRRVSDVPRRRRWLRQVRRWRCSISMPRPSNLPPPRSAAICSTAWTPRVAVLAQAVGFGHGICGVRL